MSDEAEIRSVIEDDRKVPELSAFRVRADAIAVRCQQQENDMLGNIDVSANLAVKDLVAALKAKGVTFEHYDMPDTRLEGDVHVSGDMKVAWFRDSDGNILNLASR